MDVAGARRHLAHYQRLTAVPGETRNSSQTHYGQVVDDFGMDERLADGIAALQGLAPADRLVALRVMVQDHPESTGRRHPQNHHAILAQVQEAGGGRGRDAKLAPRQ
jgi:hypothetical protein